VQGEGAREDQLGQAHGPGQGGLDDKEAGHGYVHMYYIAQQNAHVMQK
jgi:hypothetical protein